MCDNRSIITWGDFMFTTVTLKNFRTFKEANFNLSNKKGEPKPMVILYGENGSGKSNMLSAFALLNELFNTMDLRDFYEELLSRELISNNEKLNQEFKRQLIAQLRDMKTIIDDYRMIGSDDVIFVEYEFIINGSSGKYTLEFGEEELVHERLEYKLTTRKGIYFDCSKDEISINAGIFKDKDLLSDVKQSAKRYWGKHSLLAIISHERSDKSESYFWENISDNFKFLLQQIMHLSCNFSIGTRNWNKLSSPVGILQDAGQGKILISEEKYLDATESILSKFFSSINGDIRKVFYKRVYTEQSVEYELYFDKSIFGIYRVIPFSKESTGNHQLLAVLSYILSACFGATVAIDEADSGIHDVLFQKILREVFPYIKGQLILTTHNTLLMEAEFSRDTTYIISELEDGSKQIRCITDFDKRTYINNNIRNKYLGNEYGGLPCVKKLDISEFIAIVSDVSNPD